MYLSMEWLNDYLDLAEYSGSDLAELLSRTGLEVEGVNNLADELEGLRVGYVKELTDHPDSDHLRVAQVDLDEEGMTQIVCGAPNVAAGQKVIVATVGAVLPGDFKIKRAKLRGVESNGMICSLQELGFSDSVVPKAYHNGIYVLPDSAEVGADVVDYLQLDDPILDIDLTPNRADALSVRGCAYEVGAIVSQAPSFGSLEAAEQTADSHLLEAVSLAVKEDQLAPIYQLRVIDQVEIAESPVWLQLRLMKSGIRPVNNIVDVTNYYLLLYGQPMHAFDYDRLTNHTIVVDRAEVDVPFVTLDGVERTLSADDIVIKDADQVIALAGVMGGAETEVTDQTRRVLLETAVFNPEQIRLTSKRFGLRSESSARFEKGINLATVTESGDQAAKLMAQLGGGQVVPGQVEHRTITAEDVKVRLSLASILQKLGVDLSKEELTSIFNRLGFQIEWLDQDLEVTIPPRRWDIQIEADVLEEIARIYGYDNIPLSLPSVPSVPGGLTDQQALIRHTRQVAEGFGLNQVISYALTSPEAAALMLQEGTDLVQLQLPMSQERSVMRQSLLPALLEVAQYNRARQNKHLAFYETGRVFLGQGSDQLPQEAERFAILVSGIETPASWYQKETVYDFFSLKGMVEGYFEALRLGRRVQYLATDRMKVMHPGRTAEVYLDDDYVGFLGQLHPQVAADYDLDRATYFAELDLEVILAADRPELLQQPIAKFPSSTRDLALLVQEDQPHADLVHLIQSQGGPYLVSVDLFDQYAGDNIEDGKQSLAYHLVFQDPERTLTDDEIDQAMSQIQSALETVAGLEIR